MRNIKKHCKSVLALFSLVALVLEMSTVSYAFDDTREVISSIKYEEITDTDELLHIGIAQYRGNSKTRSAEDGKNTITVKQLLGVTEYADGTIEKEFCVHEIGIVDKAGEQVTAEQFAYSSGSNGNSVTNYGITLLCTIYATMRISNIPSADQVTYRCDKVTSTIVRGGEIYPGTGATEYWHSKGNEYKKASFTASVAINQTHTLTANGGFYRSNDVPMAGGLYAQSCVNLSNGRELVVHAGIPQDAPFG